MSGPASAGPLPLLVVPSITSDLSALGATIFVYMLSSVGDGLSQTIDFSGLGLDGVFQKPLAPATLLSVLKTKLK